jgi:AraC-like DNA-binding protein
MGRRSVLLRPAEKHPIDPDAAPRTAFVLEEGYPASDGAWHSHRRAQLIHSAEGVLTVHTKGGRYVSPSERGVWIPGGMAHAVSSRRPFRLLTLYVAGDRSIDDCRVVAVDRLVAELLRAAAAFGPDYPAEGPEARLVRVILDRLPSLDVMPVMHLPEPRDPALLRIAQAIEKDLRDDRTLAEWSKTVGLTEKTAARRFAAETGTTFGRWRQHVRLLAALERLGGGVSVTTVAFEVGYRDVSSFIAAFKAAMGVTPHQYFSEPKD